MGRGRTAIGVKGSVVRLAARAAKTKAETVRPEVEARRRRRPAEAAEALVADDGLRGAGAGRVLGRGGAAPGRRAPAPLTSK